MSFRTHVAVWTWGISPRKLNSGISNTRRRSFPPGGGETRTFTYSAPPHGVQNVAASLRPVAIKRGQDTASNTEARPSQGTTYISRVTATRASQPVFTSLEASAGTDRPSATLLRSPLLLTLPVYQKTEVTSDRQSHRRCI